MIARSKTNKFVIHCSATREDVRYTFADCKRDHMRRGWRDIGYHYYVETTGQIFIGRDIKVVGAHARGHNHDSVAICYEGGLDVKGKPKDTRTQEQKESIRALIDYLDALYGFDPNIDVVGHRDLFGDTNNDGKIDKQDWLKDCPCFDVSEEI